MFTDEVLRTEPAVFAVGKNYYIMVQVNAPALMWVEVAGKKYYDESNGVLKSECLVHKVIVPMAELDKAKKYTLCYRKMIERKAYYTETEEPVQLEFDFTPVTGEKIRCYHIADAHNLVEEPVKAYQNYIEANGKIDFLILNGDIPEDCSKIENVDTVYQIAAQITHGNIPIVFARGNHDVRGSVAEKYSEYTPCKNGNSYYTFRLGAIWGIILDCGEDKVDANEQYGNTICCRHFREKETEYIKTVIENSTEEYEKADVQHRIAVVHIPFTRRHAERFNIEEDLYSEWARLLKDEIKPEVMICGHEHKINLVYPGEEAELYNHPCPVIVGSRVAKNEKNYYIGTGIEFGKESINVVATDNEGQIMEIGNIEI